MAKLVIELAPTLTGKVLADFTWDFCKKIADDSAVSTAGCTLVEYGNGTYSLNNPNVAADTAFRLHLTADSTKVASGIFSLSDDNKALANADFNATQKTSLNAATPASVQNIAAQTGDAYARIGVAGAGLTALGDVRIANLDATVTSRLAPGGTLATVTSLTNPVTLAAAQPNYSPARAGDAMTLTPAYDAAKNAASATLVALVPAAVWDVALPGHLSASSTGAALSSAGTAGDPWSVILPGAYGDGSAGSIIGNRLDVAVGSRNATAPDNAGIATIGAMLGEVSDPMATIIEGSDPPMTRGEAIDRLYVPSYVGPIATIPANSDPDVQFVHFFGRKGDNTKKAAGAITALPTPGQLRGVNMVSKERLSASLDGEGYAHLTLIRGVQYALTADWWDEAFTITITDDDNRTATSYLESEA